jgi:hypothetical protein
MSSQIGSDAEADEKHSNLVAAGALLVLLGSSEFPTLHAVSPITDMDGNATNEIAVQFGFLRSTYRITIERVPD